MPIHHSSTIEDDQIEEILKYNRNDVHSTKAFYLECLDKIELRKEIGKKFKLNLINSSDVGMGENIFIKYLSKAMDKSMKDVKQTRGRKVAVDIKDVIFPYVEFRTPEFQSVLDKFRKSKMGVDVMEEFQKQLESRNSNDAEEFLDILDGLNLNLQSTKNKKKGFGARTTVQGVSVEYGIGGVHACVPPGVYASDDKYLIKDSDVKSYYPNLAIRNRLHPRQFPQAVFCSTYEQIYDDRVTAQEAGQKLVSDALKLSLNGVFGKSLDQYSCFYDPYFFAGITINGQLLLSMFAEDVLEFIPEAKMLQLNTDGMTFKIPREYELRYMQLATQWMEKTKLVLEHVNYDKMIIRDVNNYIAVGDKIKRKGTFEIVKEYHKDPSFPIIPLAVGEYFINGTPIIETLKNHKDLYDFTGRYKGNSKFNAMYVHMDYDGNGNPYERRDSYGKIMRYIPTIKGGVGIKVSKDGKITNLLSGRTMTCFNEYFEMDKSLIDYKYFEWQCQKLIESVKIPQLSLV